MNCRGTTKDGKSCSARPRPGTDLCPWHSPDLAERRAEWSARGGVNSSNASRARKRLPTEAMTPQELHSLISKALRDVLAGDLDKGIGNSVANLARTLLQVALVADFDGRLTELADEMARLRKERA